LIEKILDSGAVINTGEQSIRYFPGDDLFSILRKRGLPIGNLTSQHWANVYMNELDQFVKRELKCKAYIRYVDDMLFFMDSKKHLHELRNQVINYLQRLRLTLHEKCAQPRPSNTGVSFLGFIVFPDHRRLKRRNGVAFQRRLVKMASSLTKGEIERQQFNDSLQGWINHVRYGDTWGLRKAILEQAGLSVAEWLNG